MTNSRQRLPLSALSIVTVTYQSEGKIRSFLEAATAAAPGAEVIVVDNASRDATCAVAAEASSSARVIELDWNRGFGRACNVGATSATGTWVLFANPDVEIQSVKALPRPGESGLWAAEALTHPTHERSHPPIIRAETSIVRDWYEHAINPFVPPGVGGLLPVRARRRDWVVGALLMAQRAEFLEVGGFNSRFFLYYEDRDLGARYRRHGLAIRALAGLKGHHAVHTSSAGAADWHRAAWEFASWIEYIAIWRGERVAHSAARSAVESLSLAAKMSRFSAWRRAARKRLLIQKMLEFLSNLPDEVPHGDRTFYPYAQRVLSGQTGR